MNKQINTTNQKGFTLIELLVVIGILGVLAALLLAAIDPFEQIKKSQDSQTREVIAEFVNANTRYFGNQNAYPCVYTAAGALLNAAGPQACIATLTANGELKSTFASQTTILQKITVSQANANASVITCFMPLSKAIQRDVNTKYTTATGTVVGGTCQSQGGATACYYCLQ